MKQILFFILLLTGVQSGFAQEKVRRPLSWELAVSPGVMLEDVGGNPLTLGADTRIQQRFGRNFAWTASVAFSHFFGFEGAYFSFRGGIKAYLKPKFYIATELGYADPGEMDGPLLLISPAIGMPCGKRWDLALKYETTTDLSQFSNNQLALRFGFRLSR